MTTNELAAILARRRAKNGAESEDSPPPVEKIASPSSETVPPAGRSSIAERIARLKQQSAAANEAATTSQATHSISTSESSGMVQVSNSSVGSTGDVSAMSSAPEPIDTSAVAAAQEAAGIRRASNKIQQLQGSLEINVNPFGRSGRPSSGGYRKPSSHQKESIMSTGEELYGKSQHAMGLAVPGMTGSAIPMPGLVKGGFRLPGVATGGEQEPSTALDNTHVTMNRVAGPKRGPARPPPGAFRLPSMAPSTIDNVQTAQARSMEPVVAVEGIESKALEVPALASSQASVGVHLPSPELHTSAPVYERTTTSTPTPTSTPALVPIAAKTLPKPEPIAPMKPYELEDDPYAPVYDTKAEECTYAPPGFPGALMANFSMDELVIDDDQPKPKPVATSPPTSASSLFGASSTPNTTSEPVPPAAPIETPVPAPPTQHVAAPAIVSDVAFSVNVAPTPSPVISSLTSTAAATPARVCESMSTEVAVSSATPAAPKALPEPAPIGTTSATLAAPTLSTSTLAGAALAVAPSNGSVEDEDSSESDWSDDDNDGESLFGGPRTAPLVPSSTVVTPSRPSPEAPTPSGSLFGDVSSTCGHAPAAPFAQATSQPTTATEHYSSLFGG
ncbi:hypothetical protein PsorP6_009123 [Peronosclerospora sorghi]|uniref:Uncharacterized protein n=1 Tax=Peronosclerospora sorghi TaxID=230839 RepID=A0ACC0VWZ5_9STRA|nr:hypothetical protein PsorP6_009123 [Peronosclerospora sorghi]